MNVSRYIYDSLNSLDLPMLSPPVQPSTLKGQSLKGQAEEISALQPITLISIFFCHASFICSYFFLPLFFIIPAHSDMLTFKPLTFHLYSSVSIHLPPLIRIIFNILFLNYHDDEMACFEFDAKEEK